MPTVNAHRRIVRLTDDLGASVAFYRDGLGFDVLYQFENHDGFDVVMLGARDAAYHLALVHRRGHTAGRAPASADNLLMFYLPKPHVWQRAVARLESLRHKPVKAFNPYWDRKGKAFEDPDRYRVVLQQDRWPA